MLVKSEACKNKTINKKQQKKSIMSLIKNNNDVKRGKNKIFT